MSIVAIIPVGSGQVQIEEYRFADTPTDAVAGFCNDYTPPKLTTDYIGHDTGWASVPAEKHVYDFAVSGLVVDLVAYKAVRNDVIDARTRELIALGFTFSAKQFSLSANAQASMMGAHQIRDDPAFAYPLNWNTIDDKDVLLIADSATLHSFYLTGVGAYRGHKDSGTSLKDQVRAAANPAAVDAVVDNR